MVDCEMTPECNRPATRRLVVEYPKGQTCEEYYCENHAEEVRGFDLTEVRIVETESLH